MTTTAATAAIKVDNFGKTAWDEAKISGTVYDTLNTIVSYGSNTTTITDVITEYMTTEKQKEKVPKEVNNILFSEFGKVKVKNCKDGEVKNTKIIMSDIKNIEVKHNGENITVIFVTFKDGKTEKAVLDKDDEFSFEYGLTIIMLEKLLSDMGVDGKSVHNKLVRYAQKFYNKQEKEKEVCAKKELEAKEKKKRAEERRRNKKLKQAQADKEYQIAIQTEAYIRAMKAIKEENK
jgi:hypothetical protein